MYSHLPASSRPMPTRRAEQALERAGLDLLEQRAAGAEAREQQEHHARCRRRRTRPSAVRSPLPDHLVHVDAPAAGDARAPPAVARRRRAVASLARSHASIASRCCGVRPPAYCSNISSPASRRHVGLRGHRGLLQQAARPSAARSGPTGRPAARSRGRRRRSSPNAAPKPAGSTIATGSVAVPHQRLGARAVERHARRLAGAAAAAPSSRPAGSASCSSACDQPRLASRAVLVHDRHADAVAAASRPWLPKTSAKIEKNAIGSRKRHHLRHAVAAQVEARDPQQRRRSFAQLPSGEVDEDRVQARARARRRRATSQPAAARRAAAAPGSSARDVARPARVSARPSASASKPGERARPARGRA